MMKNIAICALLLWGGLVYGQNDRQARGKFLEEVFYEAETAAEKEKAYKQLLKKWPRENFSDREQMDYEYAIGTLTSALAEEGRSDDAIRYLGDLKERFWKGNGYSPVINALLLQGDTVKALPLLQTIVDDVRYYMSIPAEKRDNETRFALEGYAALMNQLASIHVNRGEYENAIQLLEEGIDAASHHASRFSASYAISLAAVGRKLEALQQVEILYRAGEFQYKDMLDTLYAELNGSSYGFKRYVSRLNEDVIQFIRQDIAKHAQYRDSPDFELLNLRGEKVSLASLRGKIVVLDFWATWCQPCIHSFPGMQAAQEQYDDDKSVEFLFINTWERGDNYKANVAAFIERNNYPFEVLFDDQQDPQTGQNLAARFGVQGIPAKFILDAEGKIRYALTGSDAGIEYTKMEMIELVERARRPHAN